MEVSLAYPGCYNLIPEVVDSIFDRYRDDTYREASFKPYIIAAMILLGKRKASSATLKALLSRNAPRQVL